jgi:predicted nucleic acid-binding protein
LALDTSVAIPLLVQRHAAHASVVQWWARREVALCGHAAVETYSVLTRLPGDLRLEPTDAARLLETRFRPPLTLAAATAGTVTAEFGRLGIAGGAVYDALVALAAAEHGAVLATRDARAADTYSKMGVRVVIAG